MSKAQRTVRVESRQIDASLLVDNPGLRRLLENPMLEGSLCHGHHDIPETACKFIHYRDVSASVTRVTVDGKEVQVSELIHNPGLDRLIGAVRGRASSTNKREEIDARRCDRPKEGVCPLACRYIHFKSELPNEIDVDGGAVPLSALIRNPGLDRVLANPSLLAHRCKYPKAGLCPRQCKFIHFREDDGTAPSAVEQDPFGYHGQRRTNGTVLVEGDSVPVSTLVLNPGLERILRDTGLEGRYCAGHPPDIAASQCNFIHRKNEAFGGTPRSVTVDGQSIPVDELVSNPGLERLLSNPRLEGQMCVGHPNTISASQCRYIHRVLGSGASGGGTVTVDGRTVQVSALVSNPGLQRLLRDRSLRGAECRGHPAAVTVEKCTFIHFKEGAAGAAGAGGDANGHNGPTPAHRDAAAAAHVHPHFIRGRGRGSGAHGPPPAVHNHHHHHHHHHHAAGDRYAAPPPPYQPRGRGGFTPGATRGRGGVDGPRVEPAADIYVEVADIGRVRSTEFLNNPGLQRLLRDPNLTGMTCRGHPSQVTPLTCTFLHRHGQ